MQTQQYSILDHTDSILARVDATSPVEALAVAGLNHRDDLQAVPSRYLAAPVPQPPYVPAYSPAPAAPVQQVVQLSGQDSGRRVPHGLHLVLTILTAGLWAPIWILDTLFSGKRR